MYIDTCKRRRIFFHKYTPQPRDRLPPTQNRSSMQIDHPLIRQYMNLLCKPYSSEKYAMCDIKIQLQRFLRTFKIRWSIIPCFIFSYKGLRRKDNPNETKTNQF